MLRVFGARLPAGSRGDPISGWQGDEGRAGSRSAPRVQTLASGSGRGIRIGADHKTRRGIDRPGPQEPKDVSRGPPDPDLNQHLLSPGVPLLWLLAKPRGGRPEKLT